MEFSKMNLRNNKSPLLSRLNRQTEASNEKKDIEYKKVYEKRLFGFSPMEINGESEIEKPLFAPIKKVTRLNLYNNSRGGRR